MTREEAENMTARQLSRIYSLGNNNGEGFDPTDEIDGWELLVAAETTSDVSVYMDGDEVVLVGTDGSGSDDSRWAVCPD